MTVEYPKRVRCVFYGFGKGVACLRETLGLELAGAEIAHGAFGVSSRRTEGPVAMEASNEKVLALALVREVWIVYQKF
ncbi:uncharacterized protein N7515_008060 [Penicillium bovifimosum]|uniref:Uncharacterized protein n=1 Tax=Penicillium bovifimosum TaxID=126998 RepID=A0A9W9GM70_9EURO|nr:uncharacterized protein N7515_008060 [Penicillium bovifimosum]KAJ5124235.1 hypothetical protein N7515_008060 [Penicillium bovifimosum]